jgi:hypothetical protein
MKNTHQKTQMEMQKLCNTNFHFVILKHYLGHEFKALPFVDGATFYHLSMTKMGLLIQEIGIEKFGKINPTHNTFSRP